MEKPARTRLLDAGIDLLGTRGARYATARAAEDAAGLPHGTLRHHFGNQDGYLGALTEHLLALDQPRPGESPRAVLTRWLGPERTVTRARYELTLLGVREPHIGTLVAAGRDHYVDQLVSAGLTRNRARFVVAALDGLVLDGLLRRDGGVDPAPLLVLIEEPDDNPVHPEHENPCEPDASARGLRAPRPGH